MLSGHSIRSVSQEGRSGPTQLSSSSEIDIDGPPSRHRIGTFDDDSGNEVNDDSEEKDETEMPRTRARSKSVNENYCPVENYGGLTSVNSDVIQQFKTSTAGGDSQLLTGPKPIEKIPEKKGPLPSREVEVLQKVWNR